jgi:hypothetical protein
MFLRQGCAAQVQGQAALQGEADKKQAGAVWVNSTLHLFSGVILSHFS